MHWTKDDKHPFAGIAKKLERADQNIFNLHNEILKFFSDSKYPVIPHPDAEGWQEAVDYHRALGIPKRFSVLSGEIVHHLRSCLDHLVWYFSSPQSRIDNENSIEFPVYREPLTKDQRSRYNRKIEGIANSNVIALIDGLQPYHRGNDAINDPICIIHDMDRFDKHRELTIVTACANATFPAGTSTETIRNVMKYRKGETLSTEDFAMAQRAVKNDAKVTPQVAFAQFGNRKDQFVVPALTQLLNAMDSAVDLFAIEV
jgi:hypothetical protein